MFPYLPTLVWQCLMLGILALAQLTWAWAAEPFVIGVLPVHPTRVLVTRYEPLREYLGAMLGQPAQVQSAVDFKQFHQRMLNGDFDLTITAAHLARLAQSDAGFIPLAQLRPDHDSLLLARADQRDDLADLRGGRLAVIDPLAITVMAALRYLQTRGLEAGRDYQVLTYRTHASVVHALLNRQVAAAVSTSQGLAQIPVEMRRRLRVSSPVMHVPAFTFLARPDASPQQQGQLRRLLLDFPQTLEGLDFLGQTNYRGVEPASDEVLARTDPYLAETRRLLGQP